MGFIPANVFCLALYVHAIYKWKPAATEDDSQSELLSYVPKPQETAENAEVVLPAKRSVRAAHSLRSRMPVFGDEQSFRNRDRIRSRKLSARS